MSWYGIWSGWHGLTEHSDMERFASLRSAREKFADRSRVGGTFRQYFDFVYRDAESVLTPAVDESIAYLILFGDPEFFETDQADYLIEFGPRRGVRQYRI